MLVKIEARILIFPGTDFHFPSTSGPPGTFLGSGMPKLPFFLVRYKNRVLGTKGVIRNVSQSYIMHRHTKPLRRTPQLSCT